VDAKKSVSSPECEVFDPEPQLPLPWYGLRVRTLGEPKLKKILSYKGHEVFLPTYVNVRRYTDRVKKVNEALFPGYLFCRLDAKHRLSILTTPGVESIVSVAGVPQSIAEQEIDSIRQVVDSGAPAIPWPYIQTGDRVRIEFGSLKGIEGLLTGVRGSERLILSIHLLQRSIAIEIDRSWVRPI
jgi:transcription antitermination factor NusG